MQPASASVANSLSSPHDLDAAFFLDSMALDSHFAYEVFRLAIRILDRRRRKDFFALMR